MGIIRKKEDLDRDKLNALLKARGHGVINPVFYQQCNAIFNGSNTNALVVQCKCGEVSILAKEDAKKAIEKLGHEDILCKRCGLYDLIDQPGMFFDISKLNSHAQLCTIVENEIISSETRPSESILPKINEQFKGSINATGFQELMYQIHSLNKALWLPLLHDTNLAVYQTLEGLIQNARQYVSEFDCLFSSTKRDHAQERNTRFIDIQARQYQQLREQAKFYNLPVLHDIEKTEGVSEVELDVNAELNSYNHLVEENRAITALFNLVKISEGLAYNVDPFQGESVVDNGRSVRVKTLHHRVLAFNNYPSGQPIYHLLKDLLKNRLRNAHAHNDYEIDLAERKIQYKDAISFEDFRTLVQDFRELKILLFLLLLDSYFQRHPIVRNMVLGYDDPDIVNDKLKPAEESTLSELHIEGYRFSTDNLPEIDFQINDSEMLIITPLSVDGYPMEEEGTMDWIRQIKINEGKLKVSFNNILDWNTGQTVKGRPLLFFDQNNRIANIICVPNDVLDVIKQIFNQKDE